MSSWLKDVKLVVSALIDFPKELKKGLWFWINIQMLVIDDIYFHGGINCHGDKKDVFLFGNDRLVLPSCVGFLKGIN